MNYKRDFIKRERVTDKKIPAPKEPYRGVSGTNDTDENTTNKNKKDLRKDEPFVLMFRDFIFFDVKSYECRNGDLYIRSLVDGIVLKRYFRMGSDDQLTVFKNRKEFDEFMDLDSYTPVIDPDTGEFVSIKSLWDGESFTYEDNPSFFDMVAKVFEKHSINEVLGRKGGVL